MIAHADVESQGFWEALERGELEVPRCGGCGRLFFPPLPSCPNCGSTEIGPERVSGRVSAYSWIKVHRALDPEFEEFAPYTLVTVSLAEEASARLVAVLAADDDLELQDGTALEVFPLTRNGVVVPAVRPFPSANFPAEPTL